jgi:carboxypeptidase C (cathepsin A)
MPLMRFMISCLLLALLTLPVYSQTRRGRGDSPDASPAPGARGGGDTNAPTSEKIDETLSVTHHSIQVDGKTLNYTATAAEMPILNANGETEAHMFYVAYTLDSETNNAARRPLTFSFNGGPGSASIWVHMGAFGPKRAKLMDNGDMPPPPYEIADNEDTLLEYTDLVFIDAIGTGYSRAKTPELAHKYEGVQGDLQSFSEFIRMYITRNSRWLSPLFLAGESYGTFRAAGLAGQLVDQGIALNGVVLVSTILYYETARATLANGLPYALNLPTYSADAWYHKKLTPDLQKMDVKSLTHEVEGWAMSGYMDALNQGDSLTGEARKAAVAKYAHYTGLDPRYVDRSNLRIGVGQFTRELLRDEGEMIGRYDGRLTAPAPMNMSETGDFDPSGTLPLPPFRAAFEDYVRGNLEFKTDMTYYVSGGISPWDWGVQNSYVETASLLRDAFNKNPHLKVLVCAGYFDLACPYYDAEYALNHLGVHPETQKNISWAFFEAGHMMYIDAKCHAKLKNDIGNFIQQNVPAR